MPSVHGIMNQDSQLASTRNMVGTTVRIMVAVIPSLNAILERRVVQDVRTVMVAEVPLKNGNLENCRKKRQEPESTNGETSAKPWKTTEKMQVRLRI